jgi:hypothetical protein
MGSPKLLLLVGVCFLVGGAVLASALGAQIPSDVALLARGQVTQGKVVGVEMAERHRPGHQPVMVRFSYAHGGQTYQGQSHDFDQRFLAATPGTVVAVEMLPSHPTWARVVGTTRSWTGYVGAFALLLPLAGAVTVAFGLRNWRRASAA